MVKLEDVKERMHQKVWGERSLTLGELVAFIVAGFLIWRNLLGKWTVLVALAMVFIACALF